MIGWPCWGDIWESRCPRYCIPQYGDKKQTNKQNPINKNRLDSLSFPEMLKDWWEEKVKREGGHYGAVQVNSIAPEYGKYHIYQIRRKHKEPVTPHCTPELDVQEAEQISHTLADNSLGSTGLGPDPQRIPPWG